MRIVVLGATGFLGRRVTAMAHRTGAEVVAVARRSAPWPIAVHSIDLRRPLPPHLLLGATVVLHCAHALTGSRDELFATNVDGTRRVVDAAAAAGARVGILSTAAVYGHQGFERLTGGSTQETPNSTLSESRLVADHLVTAAGGWTLRPHLVIGGGDRWVIPQLLTFDGIALARRGSARHSVIHATQVAALMVGLALRSSVPAGSVMHASTADSLTLSETVRLTLAAGVEPVASAEPDSRRLRWMADTTMTLDSSAEWDLAGLRQPRRPRVESQDARWYRDFFSEDRRRAAQQQLSRSESGIDER